MCLPPGQYAAFPRLVYTFPTFHNSFGQRFSTRCLLYIPRRFYQCQISEGKNRVECMHNTGNRGGLFGCNPEAYGKRDLLFAIVAEDDGWFGFFQHVLDFMNGGEDAFGRFLFLKFCLWKGDRNAGASLAIIRVIDDDAAEDE